MSETDWPLYEVFVRARSGLAHKHVGSLHAPDAEMALQNAALQAGYFIVGVRAAGLAAGPMGGFDADAVGREFFPDGAHRPVLVVNIGHPGENAWFDRLPRLGSEDVITWA